MRNLPLLSGLLLAAACVPLGTPITDPNAARRPATPGQTGTEYYADKKLRYEDYIYDPNVRTVLCYVPTGQLGQVFNPPVVPLGQGQAPVLEFDVLGGQGQRLTAKLIHCDLNWQPSILTDMQFLSEINEQLITNYRPSVSTKVPYQHYQVQMPRVKLSGNYLWVVQGAGGTPLLSRRVLVFEEGAVQIAMKQGIPVAGQERYILQQVDFGIRYNMALVNPAVEVKVVLRQNFRWDNAHYNLRPTFVRDAEQQLDYQYFNFENAFPGLSEFRFVDLRTFRSAGIGVAKIDAEVHAPGRAAPARNLPRRPALHPVRRHQWPAPDRKPRVCRRPGHQPRLPRRHVSAPRRSPRARPGLCYRGHVGLAAAR